MKTGKRSAGVTAWRERDDKVEHRNLDQGSVAADEDHTHLSSMYVPTVTLKYPGLGCNVLVLAVPSEKQHPDSEAGNSQLWDRGQVGYGGTRLYPST